MRSKRIIWVISILVAAIFIMSIPSGCRTAYAWSADRATKPVIKAIEAYKIRTGNLPTSLSDLPSEPDTQKPLKLQGLSDVGLVWSINYQNMSNGTYWVSFNHVHYDVTYKNGKRDNIQFNFFR